VNDFWFMTFTNAPPAFFRDENTLSEGEWRRKAPPSEVERLDAALVRLRT